MSEEIRSFIAFDLDNEVVLRNLAQVQNLVLETRADVKIVEPENIHITLRFLGNVSADMVEQIFDKIKRVQFVPFDVKIHGIGAFPNARFPRVIWAGITDGATQLKSIFDQLEPNMQKLGFAPDPKGFSPHLTIARVKSNKNKDVLAEYIKSNADYEFGTVKARCLRLKRSELTPSGPIYSTLKEFCS